MKALVVPGLAFGFSLAFALSAISACKKPGPPDGAELFASNCSRCHGAKGEGGIAALGGGTPPRNFRDHVFQSERTDEQLAKVIQLGKGSGMPAFGSMFDDGQRKALIGHIRSFDPK